MKVIFKPNSQLAFELAGEDAKALFRQIAEVQEVFAAEAKCGLCGSLAIGYSHRHIDDYDYYELRCLDCRADFKFGQTKQGGRLFPKRTDDDRRPLPNGGWSRYEPGQQVEHKQVEQSKAPAPRPQQVAQNAVPRFASWNIAQGSREHWGADRLEVAGKLYKLVDGQYRLEASASDQF